MLLVIIEQQLQLIDTIDKHLRFILCKSVLVCIRALNNIVNILPAVEKSVIENLDGLLLILKRILFKYVRTH